MGENGLMVAVHKTEVRMVKSPRGRERIKVNSSGVEIIDVGEFKHLGVTLQKGLSFSGHIRNLVGKARKKKSV